MRPQRRLIALSFMACLSLVLFHIALSDLVNAADRVAQSRHSLIARPSIVPQPKAPRLEPQPAEASKRVSLVSRFGSDNRPGR
jgi:hypothetical protein